MSEKDDHYFASIRTGDKQGIKNIYSAFLPGIINLVSRNGGSRDDAMDIFQDALIILFEKTRTEGFKLTSSFYTLLYGICRNLWGNRLQKRSFKETSIPEDYSLASDDDFGMLIQLEEKRSIFWKAFRQLGEDCQRLLQLFFDKTPMEEIAQLMNFASEGYAKKRKFQCKEHLIRIVKEDVRFQDYVLT